MKSQRETFLKDVLEGVTHLEAIKHYSPFFEEDQAYLYQAISWIVTDLQERYDQTQLRRLK